MDFDQFLIDFFWSAAFILGTLKLIAIILAIPGMAGEYPGIAPLIDDGMALTDLGRYNESIEAYLAALNYSDISAGSAANAYLGIALNYARLEIYREAIHFCDRSMEFTQSHAFLSAAMKLKASCQMALGDTDGANSTTENRLNMESRARFYYGVN